MIAFHQGMIASKAGAAEGKVAFQKAVCANMERLQTFAKLDVKVKAADNG